ncbi:hypothetical protein AMATHDRAFT_7492 [Amanita thiersii Skay4041]|uniref:DUF6534 domain-containing protein n=1 Tax=Amanita thiersii Skay4041 TaxID=703135 RepID=A0A2A9N8J1_9AGAR|nr:hypothetical protein AMATHDRAFT_7492 [Amanita thiersii Skay4041]
MPSSGFALFSGPIFIGALLNWGLFGTLVMQVCKAPYTTKWIKALVYTLFTLDVMQTGCATHWAWDALLSKWGDPTTFISQISWSAKVLPIYASLASVPTQLFFAWRIWKLNQNHFICRFISAWISMVSLMQGIGGIATGVMLFVGSPPDLQSGLDKVTQPVEVWLFGSLVCDVLLASTMTFTLFQAHRSSSLKKTETILTKLIIHTVETGAITALTTSADVVLFLMYKDTYLHLVPYTNVCLANLNGRTRSNPQIEEHQLTTTNTTTTANAIVTFSFWNDESGSLPVRGNSGKTITPAQSEEQILVV